MMELILIDFYDDVVDVDAESRADTGVDDVL